MQQVNLIAPRLLFYTEGPVKYHHDAVVDWPQFRVEFVGLCATDQEILNHPPVFPLIMGHEIVCSEDTEEGKAYYVINNEVACGHCQYCLDGNVSHCENLIELGVNEQGGYAEFIKAPRSYLVPFDLKPPELGVLVEPCACTLHALERLKTVLLNIDAIPIRILILGLGVMGKIFASLLLELSQSKSINIFAYDKKRELRDWGRTIPQLQVLTHSQLKESTFDVCIECTGTHDALNTAFQLIKHKGVVFLFGVPPKGQKITLTSRDLFDKELTISSAKAGCRRLLMEEAIAHIKNHQDFFASLLGERISLEELPRTLLFDPPAPGKKTFVRIGPPQKKMKYQERAQEKETTQSNVLL